MEVGRTIVGAIAAGNFPSVACRLAGVNLLTLERWLERGDKGEQPYADFAQALRKAEDEDHAAMVAIWKNAAPEDWRAAKEYLAKRYPEQWSDHAARLAVLGPEDYGGVVVGVGLNIVLMLGGEEDLPEPDPRQVEARQELDDHRQRERDIEIIEVLGSAPIKDTL